MDNSTILAWIFTSLLLIVGTMLFKNSRSADRKSLSNDSCGSRKKILIVGNNILFSENGSECDVYQQNIATLIVLIRKYDVLGYVAVQVKNEREGERIRDDLFDAGLNSVHDSFCREKILTFTQLSSLKTIATVLGVELIVTSSLDVNSLFANCDMPTVLQTADSFSKEF